MFIQINYRKFLVRKVFASALKQRIILIIIWIKLFFNNNKLKISSIKCILISFNNNILLKSKNFFNSNRFTEKKVLL